jgi:hypothetical protein
VADVEMPDGTVIYGVPDGVTKADLLTRLKRNGYDTARLLTPRQEENLLEQVPLVGGALAGLADIPLSAAQGLAGTGKTLTDLFGADNAVSGFLGDVTRLAGELKSAGSREDAITSAAIQKEAEDKGIWEQVKAAGKSFALSPIETTASVLGSAVPFAAAAMTGGGLPAAAALGAASGVGMIKGDIYDAVVEEFTKAGVPPEQAAAAAEKAQEYGGENTDMMALGGALGALAAATGVAPAVANRLGARAAAKATSQAAARETAEKAALAGLPAGAAAQVTGKAAPGFARSALTGAVSEALPEGAQAGQERYAQNLALQREGFDVDPMKGVAGQAAFEAIASLIPGAGGKVYETQPERDRAAIQDTLQQRAAKITSTLSSEQATPEEKDAAVRQMADDLLSTGFAATEEEALELAENARRRTEARAQAGKDAKTTPEAEAAATTPVDEIPEPVVRGKKGAKKAQETQEAGLDGGAGGPDVAVAGAAGPSVPDIGATPPAGEATQTAPQAKPIGVAGTGEPAGVVTGAETGADGTLTPNAAVIRPDDVFRGNGAPTITVKQTDKPFVVRATKQDQIDDMIASGLVRPKPGGYGKQQNAQIYFGESETAAPSSIFARPKEGGFVLVGKSENLVGKEGPIPIDQLEHIWENRGGELVDILPDVIRRNQEFAPQAEPMTVQSYVDRYIAGEGRDSLEMQQFAANFAPEIEAEFQKRVSKPAPTTETPSAVEEGIAPEATQEEPVATATEGQRAPAPAAEVEVTSETAALQKFVDENNPGYEVRFNPELKTRPWSIGVPGGKLVARSTSASGLRKAVMKQPKVGPRETVDGVEVVRYPAVKPKAATTPKDIFSRDAVDPEDVAGKLNEAQQEQVDLLIDEIDKARKARDINDAERTELVRMLEDTREVASTATNRPTTTTGRNKDFIWSVINFTQDKVDTLRKAGKKLRTRQEAVGKDLFKKGVKLTPEEQALKNEIKANAAEMKKQAALLLEQKRTIYDRARKRMAEMKADRTKKLNALRADFKAGRITEQKYRALMGQLRPDMIMYRKGRGAPNGISLEEMNTVVRAITSRWKANVNVKMVQSVDDLPPAIRSQLEQDDRLDAFGFLQGDDVYLIADNMDSVEDVAPTLFHEVLGHLGLRRAFREGLDDVLTDIYNTNQKVREATDRWMAANEGLYSGDEDPLARAVEEVLAEASEDGTIAAGKIDRLVRFLRNAIRKVFGTDLAISDREVRVILAMAHEQALGGDSNAVGSDSVVYAGKKKPAAKKPAVAKVINQEARIAKNHKMVGRSAADRLDPEKFNQSVADMIKTGLEAREFKYWMGLMSPKKFADRFMALRGLRLLDTNDMIEYAATLLGADHPAIEAMSEAVKAVGRLNGTRVAIRTRMGVIITDLRKFTETSPLGAERLAYSIDYNSRFNINAGAFKPGMSEQDALQTDGAWKFYNNKLANPKLTDKDRDYYTKQLAKRAADVVGGFRAWNELGQVKGAQEMYTRLRDMHRKLYDQRRIATEQFMEDLKDAGASDMAIKRMVLDLRQQHDKLHDRVNAPAKGEGVEDYPDVPLGLFHREYFPRRRYGRFWLRVKKTGFGKPVLIFYESAAERDADLEGWAEELKKKKEDSSVFAFGDDVSADLSDFDTPSVNSALYQVMDKIQKTNPTTFTNEQKEKLISDVYQLSLLASPEGTIRKQFIKSKKRLGSSVDTLRVTADTIEEYATDLARLKHRNEIDRHMMALKNLTDPKGEGKEPADRIKMIRSFYASMEERIESEYKPATDSVAGAIVAGANQLAYISFLTAAATAITQITGIPMRVAPYLYARYGIAGTTKALARYMNVFKATPKLEDAEKGQSKSLRLLTMRESNIIKNDPRRRAALEAANRDYGIVTPMSTYNMRRGRTPGTAAGLKRERAWDTFYDGMTYMLDVADQLTREAAFMAAYDLEYDKLSNLEPKERQQAAIDSAAKAIADTLGNFNSIYRPPVMKGSELAKAVYLFKYYSVITTAFFFRAGRAMARGIAAIGNPDKKSQREEAAIYTKELTGTLAAGFVFGGLTGMPLFTIGMAALQALQDGTDDDDDRRARMKHNPYTADSVEAQFIYEWLPNHFGSPTINGVDGKPHTLAGVLLNGPASELSGWNLGSRVSLDLAGLWFRSPRDADTWKGLINNALVENIPGASASLNIVDMGEKIAEGNIIDALKVGLPAQLKAAVKAYEFATEGVRTGNEKIRVAKEDLTNADIIGVAIGYSPTEVAKTQRFARTVTGRIKELNEQKTELLKDVKIAYRRVRNGDPGARAELNAAFAEVRDYNKKIGNPAYVIDPYTVLTAMETSAEDDLFDIAGMGLDVNEAVLAQGMGPQ